MFRDLVKKASNMTAAAMENLQTPEKDGGTDGGKAGNKGNPTSTPSSGIKNASREDLIDLLRRTRAQNKQIKQKYIELSKKEKYFERRSESLTTFLTDTVGIKIEEDDGKTTIVEIEKLKSQWVSLSQKSVVTEEIVERWDYTKILFSWLPVSSDAQIEKDNVQTLNSTINKLKKNLQSNMEEKDKLLKKLKEVVGKYKQLQTHARALKEKLEKQERYPKAMTKHWISLVNLELI